MRYFIASMLGIALFFTLSLARAKTESTRDATKFREINPNCTPDDRNQKENTETYLLALDIYTAPSDIPLYYSKLTVAYNFEALEFIGAEAGDFLGTPDTPATFGTKKGKGEAIFFACRERIIKTRQGLEGRVDLGYSLLGNVEGKKSKVRKRIATLYFTILDSKDFKKNFRLSLRDIGKGTQTQALLTKKKQRHGLTFVKRIFISPPRN